MKNIRLINIIITLGGFALLFYITQKGINMREAELYGVSVFHRFVLYWLPYSLFFTLHALLGFFVFNLFIKDFKSLEKILSKTDAGLVVGTAGFTLAFFCFFGLTATSNTFVQMPQIPQIPNFWGVVSLVVFIRLYKDLRKLVIKYGGKINL